MSESLPSTHAERGSVGRWEFIRDVLVFQLKLALDALRDLLLVPASLVAALIDLLSGNDRPGRYFYAVFDLGGRADIWIDLFATYRPEDGAEESPKERTVDSLVGQLERLIVHEYERGGVTASAKDAIDRSLDAISRRARR